MTGVRGLLLEVREGTRLAAFERACADPAAAQARLLARILARNAETAFGRDNAFASIASPDEYARALPVSDYEAFRPYVERLLQGERAVLTADAPRVWHRTSGTTSQPKLVPAPHAWCQEMATLTRLWVLRALRDHPEAEAGRSLVVTSPAIEGHTPGGMPIGSVSGLTNQGIPWIVRRLFAIPSAVALVEDPDQRYFLTMRIALQHDVTVIGTPNATTLLRLAEVTRGRADQILDAIAHGSLGVDPAFGTGGDARTALEELKDACRPAPERARALARDAARAGALTPRLAWPRLALIGCWLGGSAGVHARRLAADFGEAPLRDLGLVATEGRLTLPFEDGTPSGVLCVDTTYFEFTPVDAPDRAPALRAHQLERGGAYNVIVTGSNGLYRYDLQDVVEVRAFHGRTPQVAFLRKAGDFVSITGEKVHVNQVADAVRAAEAATGLHLWQFRLIADVDGLRHDLLVEAREAVTEPRALHFLESFDRRLSNLNSEYAAKRRSDRLHPPRIHLMRSGWSERIARAEFARGRREQQFKWVTLPSAWDGASRAEVELTVAR